MQKKKDFCILFLIFIQPLQVRFAYQRSASLTKGPICFANLKQ